MVLLLLLIFCATTPSVRAASVWDSVPDAATASTDTVTFADVLSLIKRHNPTLRALPYRGAAATASIEQAGAWPNPTLIATAENVDGSYSGFDRSELSLWLSQEFELGGKRGKRVELATRVADEVARDADAESFEVYLEAKSRFAAVAHAEEQARVIRESEAIVAELSRTARERVKVGATLIADAALADAALARVRVAITSAETDRFRARMALASMWGEPRGFDGAVPRRAPIPGAIPSPDSVVSWALHSADVARARLASASNRASVAVERSLRVPNVTLDAGARRIEADDATTLLFSLGLPLPLWDRRTGAIREAEARVGASEIEVERARATVASELAGHIAAEERLRAQISHTETELEPAMVAAVDNMRSAYGIGRVSYSDLLEAQRALLLLRIDANDARLAITQEVIAIERLTGRTIEELMSHE